MPSATVQHHPQTRCAICGRTAQVGFRVPHSVHRTKRRFAVNLHPMFGAQVCTRCRRTLLK